MPSPLFPVQYNIPRYNVALPGKQNRAGRGEMRITPGLTEPMEFAFGNMDGIPINLANFTLRLVFWFSTAQYDRLTDNIDQSGIVLVKNVEVKSPYEGQCTVLLSSDDTSVLGRPGRHSLRWSLYLINDQGEVFPAQITGAGDRYGMAQIEQTGMPTGEIVKGSTVAL